MQQQLISLNPDLKKLLDEGYQLEVIGGHLLAHQIPYVNSKCEIKYGTLVSVLTYLNPTKVGQPQDHTIYFCGDAPCDLHGKELTSIINNSQNQQLTTSILANHYFSSKPPSGNYPDYYEKIRTYAEIISSQAKGIDKSVTAKPERLKIIDSGSDVFAYPDTNSARANIEYLNRKFRNQKIAIIGLGGTGSYILDLVSKTPVKEIHIYDKDIFQLHNTFRAPGTVPKEKFEVLGSLKKVEYYFEVYSRLHNGIVMHDEYVTKTSINEFSDFDFVFISVDSNETRSNITTGLLNIGVSFIDVGLGVNKVEDSLIGTLRVTLGSKEKNDHLKDRIGNAENDANEYSTNIQIADLNCLNATLAVIKWKKTLSYYQDLKEEHNTLYFINTGKVLNENIAT
jgi:molybdopterin/thiamine biosynthesis adenylyltransferase